jgi:hypothetical protein
VGDAAIWVDHRNVPDNLTVRVGSGGGVSVDGSEGFGVHAQRVSGVSLITVVGQTTINTVSNTSVRAFDFEVGLATDVEQTGDDVGAQRWRQ